jgi:hypothetical protein
MRTLSLAGVIGSSGKDDHFGPFRPGAYGPRARVACSERRNSLIQGPHQPRGTHAIVVGNGLRIRTWLQARDLPALLASGTVRGRPSWGNYWLALRKAGTKCPSGPDARRDPMAIPEPKRLAARHSAPPAGRIAGHTGLLPAMGPATLSSLFHGVDGAPAGPQDPRAWTSDLPVIARHRLAGLALAAAERANVRLDPETESQLQETRGRDAARALSVESAGLEVIRTLDQAGIRSVVTKGPGIAHAFPQFSLRPYRDIDILVPPPQFEPAMRLLAGIGFVEPDDKRPPRAYVNGLCREGVNLVRGSQVGSVDLHQRIPPWVWGRRITFTHVIEKSRIIALAGGHVRVADPLHNLLIAALHMISDKGRPGRELMIWRDVAVLCRACDPAEAAREARRARIDWCLRLVLEELPPYAQPRELLSRVKDARPGAADSFRLRHLLPPAMASRHQIHMVFRLPVLNGVALMAGYLVPSQQFIRSRYGGSLSYWRWWRDALGRLNEARSRSPAGPVHWP